MESYDKLVSEFQELHRQYKVYKESEDLIAKEIKAARKMYKSGKIDKATLNIRMESFDFEMKHLGLISKKFKIDVESDLPDELRLGSYIVNLEGLMDSVKNAGAYIWEKILALISKLKAVYRGVAMTKMQQMPKVCNDAKVVLEEIEQASQGVPPPSIPELQAAPKEELIDIARLKDKDLTKLVAKYYDIYVYATMGAKGSSDGVLIKAANNINALNSGLKELLTLTTNVLTQTEFLDRDPAYVKYYEIMTKKIGNGYAQVEKNFLPKLWQAEVTDGGNQPTYFTRFKQDDVTFGRFIPPLLLAPGTGDKSAASTHIFISSPTVSLDKVRQAYLPNEPSMELLKNEGDSPSDTAKFPMVRLACKAIVINRDKMVGKCEKALLDILNNMEAEVVKQSKTVITGSPESQKRKNHLRTMTANVVTEAIAYANNLNRCILRMDEFVGEMLNLKM